MNVNPTMTLENLLFFVFISACVILIVRHLNISRRAYFVTRQRTQELGVVLLDESIVLSSMRVRWRSPLLAIERQYSFEFSTVGDVRYPGVLVLLGHQIDKFELAPYKTIDQ